jgi:hypothetical protein
MLIAVSLSVSVLTVSKCQADATITYVRCNGNRTVILPSDQCSTFTQSLKGIECTPSLLPQCLQVCFPCLIFSDTLGPTHPPIQWVQVALSLWVKRLRREADHSPPSSAAVKNGWSYTSTPQFVFMAWCLVKHRDNFTLIDS